MTLSLPVIDRPIDNTALSAFMRCPREYNFGMRQHRRKIHSSGSSPALAYGTAWHRAMELHYKTDGFEEAVYRGIEQSWQEHGRPDDHRTKERVWMEYQNYVTEYGKPSEELAKTVGYPDSPLVEMSVNATWPGAAHPYAGKIDRIIELEGHYYVEDHKTTSRMGDYYFKQFELSNQMMGYVWIARQLVPNIKIAGVRINAHCVLTRASKFRRQIISYGDEQLAEWAENYNVWVTKLQEAYATDTFPGNYSACDGKYGTCQYADVCSMPPKLRQRTLEFEYEVNPWNPLEADIDEPEA